MTPGDPRHGTNAGYIAGCHDTCCKHAHATYRRNLYARQYLARGGMTIPALGSQRRIQALQAIGWRIRDIAGELDLWVADNGVCQTLWQLMRRDMTTRATAARIDAVYRRLNMTPGPSNHSRARAVNRGYLPPLAWDDIDDPDERPNLSDARSSIDEAAIERVLAGDIVPTTFAERVEITRRWQARGRSLSELERRTGWKSDRYTTRGDAA